MKYAKIDKFEIVNGEDVGISVYTYGCIFHCKNCFNSELWDLDRGEIWTDDTTDYLISLVKSSNISRVSFLGGEPLLDRNIDELKRILKRLREEFPKIQIWVYSGYTYEQIKDRNLNDLLSYIDILVDGRYVDELRDYTLKFRGSSNQRVIDVQNTIKCNEVITLY